MASTKPDFKVGQRVWAWRDMPGTIYCFEGETAVIETDRAGVRRVCIHTIKPLIEVKTENKN